jgi:hypothetical protein
MLSPIFETILISAPSGPDANPLIILIEPVPPARTVIKMHMEILDGQSIICGDFSSARSCIKYKWQNFFKFTEIHKLVIGSIF